MPEHIVTGTTEEEREKEIHDYMIEHGQDDKDARLYAITLGCRWMPELEPNYIEFFNHLELSNIRLGEISISDLFRYWGRRDLRTAVRLLWTYKEDDYQNPGLVYLCGMPIDSL